MHDVHKRSPQVAHNAEKFLRLSKQGETIKVHRAHDRDLAAVHTIEVMFYAKLKSERESI